MSFSCEKRKKREFILDHKKVKDIHFCIIKDNFKVTSVFYTIFSIEEK